jgi:hypothetical protein
MDDNLADRVTDLQHRIANGDANAYDELGNLYFDSREKEKAAECYLEAYVRGMYRPGQNLGLLRLRGMFEVKEISESSDVYRRFQDIRDREEQEDRERARIEQKATSAGATAAIIGFLVTVVLIYASGTHGYLRDFVLLVAIGVAVLCAKAVQHSVRND